MTEEEVWLEKADLFMRKQPDSTLFYYQRIIDRCDKLADQGLCAKAYADLDYLYSLMGENENALSNYRFSLQKYGRIKEANGLAKVYNNLGVYYLNKNKDSAEHYFLQSLIIYRRLDLLQKSAANLRNLASTYLRHKWVARYPQAKEALLEAERIYSNSKDTSRLAFLYSSLGGYAKQAENDLNKSKDYYLKALSLSQVAGEQRLELNLLAHLISLYRDQGDYQSAFDLHVDYFHLHEELYTLEKDEAFQEIQTKYEVEKKNRELAELATEKARERDQKRLLALLASILLLIIGGTTLYYRQRHQLQQANRRREQAEHQRERERLESEKQLNRIKGLIDGQEQERSRLAQELHDGIAGRIGAMKWQLSTLASDLQLPALDHSSQQLDDIYADLRHVSHELSELYTAQLDIKSFLKEQTEFYKDSFSLQAIIHPDELNSSLPPETKHQLFRILQELLLNAHKHAQASTVSVQVLHIESQLEVVVEDNGIGFSVEQADGVGLANIRNRLNVLGGNLHLDSHPQKGSTFMISIPLSEA